MRTAIVEQINTIAELAGRVYQAFLAPDDLTTPYATVKMLEELPVSENFLGSNKGFQVFIYSGPDDFVDLDVLEIKVRNKLDHVFLTYSVGPPVKKLQTLYVQTIQDQRDDDRDLNFIRVDFEYFLTRPGN